MNRKRKKENILHLSKVDPKRQNLSRETKEILIPFRDWSSYHKNIYESLDVMDNIKTMFTEEENFSVEDIEFGLINSQKEKLRTSKVTKKKY
jgi:hypothetical protein